MKRTTIKHIGEKYRQGERLAMLTAYDATFARLVDDAGVDMILVGDSLGMVVQGHETTIPVTLGDVIYHTACVARGTRQALVIADLPFMSYQASGTQRLMTQAGIPVMAHIGLKPQRFHQMGGYKIQGRTEEEAAGLVREARAFEEAGAFSIVLEGVAVETAREITEAIKIPTIGIGCGPDCSGQVLVIYDLLGLNPDFRPSFVKVYADGYGSITDAAKRYVDDVRSGTFPTAEHGFRRG
jgi:3-methyl-2-oxobutanoate hydroxymethyltransferase